MHATYAFYRPFHSVWNESLLRAMLIMIVIVIIMIPFASFSSLEPWRELSARKGYFLWSHVVCIRAFSPAYFLLHPLAIHDIIAYIQIEIYMNPLIPGPSHQSVFYIKWSHQRRHHHYHHLGRQRHAGGSTSIDSVLFFFLLHHRHPHAQSWLQ